MRRATRSKGYPLPEGSNMLRWRQFTRTVSITAWLSTAGACATPDAMDFDGAARELPPGAEFGISGGQVDLENRYQSVVLVSSERGFCSGVLVAPKLILTA